MRFWKFRWLAILAILALALTACSMSGDDDDAQDTPTQSATAVIDTTTTGEIQLTQSITTENGTITVSYPDGWAAQDVFGSITLTNNPALLNSTTQTVGTGNLVGNINYVVSLNLADFGLEEGATPLEVLTALQTLEPDLPVISPPTAFDANGKAAAISTVALTLDGQSADSVIVILDAQDGYGQLSFIVSPGEAATFEPTIRAIAGTFIYTPGESQG
jgi:hypothetical protein